MKRQKKKKKRLSDVSVPQSWPRWAHSVSHTRVTVERGIKFGIDQNRDAAANCWRLAPATHAGRAASSPEIFRQIWPSVWPSSRSNFHLGPSPLDSTEKKSFISELMILECSFPLIFAGFYQEYIRTGVCNTTHWVWHFGISSYVTLDGPF